MIYPNYENGSENETITGKYVTPNIVLCDDGNYRWFYDFNMYKNPSILYTIFKVLAFSLSIVWLFVLFLVLSDGDGIEGVLEITKVFGIIMIGFIMVGTIAYLIVAATYGGSYIVLFELNEETVNHIHVPKQFKKAQAIGWITMFAGAIAGNITANGQGLLVAGHSSSTSVFKNVASVKVKRKRNIIYVNQLLGKNQVYASDEDFDFVEQFIISHCPNAKIK
ncbi:MAG: hypothetical protein K6B28_09880 [Lachnospiraceae bacterium]|nr:hypothetical protein [Lachnospiraceae bacterium]